jgi:ligand-binding sensor domain-containing protein
VKETSNPGELITRIRTTRFINTFQRHFQEAQMAAQIGRHKWQFLLLSAFILFGWTIEVRSEWQTFTGNDGLASNLVARINEDQSGNIWIAYGQIPSGVTRYNGVTWRSFTEDDGLADNRVFWVLEDRSGKLWFATDEGVTVFDGVRWKTYQLFPIPGAEQDRVHCILEDSWGHLWFGAGRGLMRYDGSKWDPFTTREGLAGNNVYCLLEDHLGDLWVGTWKGVSRISGSSVDATYKTDNSGLVDDTVYSIAEDRHDNIWFGTEGGVSKYNRNRECAAP